jgi:putative flippase GtrA
MQAHQGRRESLVPLLRQGWRFSLVGVLNTAVDISAFATLVWFAGLGAVVANVLSYSLGVVTSYVCNRRWTFAAPGQPPHSWSRFAAFIGANLAGLLLSTAIVAGLAPIVPVLAAKGAATVGTMAWNFLIARRIFSPS